MSDGYKLKITTESPTAIKKLGGDSLFSMIGDMIHNVKGQMMNHPFMMSDSPFFSLKKQDFDIEDPIVDKFFDNGGFDIINKAQGMKPDKAHAHFVMCYENLNNFRLANLRQIVRNAYNCIQNSANNSSLAVKFERVANKIENKSTGWWQLESLKQIDQAVKFATASERKTLRFARSLVLKGEKDYLETASELVKSVFENNTIKHNIRVAYTTLRTQDNEPYLLCPKGIYNGSNNAGPVPMEISKCRENCIDSRVAKDGTVSCAYEDWLKVSFEPHAKVMARLDVHHSPDNKENALELEEGERSKKLTEGEFGFEARFDKSTQGANALRGKQNLTESREKQLSDNKSVQWGHQAKDTAKRPVQAQTDSSKTIDSQLPRKGESGNDYLEALLRKLNRIESETETVREDQLDEAGLYSRKGDMEESYAEQLLDGDNPISYRDELNKDKEEPTESISNQLNKNISTAAKKNKELSQEELLEDSRRNKDSDDTKEMQLKERRLHKSDRDIDKTMEELLGDDDYQQFSEEDLEHFAHELGLDSYLEDKRNTYKLEP